MKSGVSAFTRHKMNDEELRLLLTQASAAFAKTKAKLKEAKKVVAEWRKLQSDEDWDEATLTFKNKTLVEWKQEVAELEEREKEANQRQADACAAFIGVSQGNCKSFSNSSPSF